MSKIKLSCLMPSYNKGEYIKQAIDSVLMQKTNFDFNLIITDDCSTDDTLKIVNEYIKKYQGKIILLPSNKNQGLLSNIIKAYEYMNCEYFVCLDPDDYLVDDCFYQKAVDFLENHKDFNIYAANTSVINPNGKIYQQNTEWPLAYYDSTFADMLVNKYPLGNTISSVFRNNVINKALIAKIKSFVGNQYDEAAYREDDFRNRVHLQKGKAHWVNEIVGVYRWTPSGLFRGSNELKKHLLKVLSFINMYLFFDKNYPEFIKQAEDRALQMAHILLKGNLNNILNYSSFDIAKFFEVINFLNLYNAKFIDALIKQLRDDKIQQHIPWYQKFFSIKQAGSHKILRLVGLKIKLKNNR